MNTFKKYCPNVFVAQCEIEYKKGDIITLETKYGKEIESEVHNYLGKTKEGFYLYSITRLDGFNSQERAKNKAEKLEGYANNAGMRSNQYYEASHEGRDYLSLGEPIKIGHHSERRHRKLIERNWERMGKCVMESDKAKEYERRAEYWKERANKIDLSLPDSLEYFEYELEKAKNEHQILKDNPEKRSHGMSLQYANKKVKDLQENVNLAIRLWGSDDEIKQLDIEKKEITEKKASKGKKIDEILKKYHVFFAFGVEQIKEGIDNLKANGIIEEGENVTNLGSGVFLPSKFKEEFLKEFKYTAISIKMLRTRKRNSN
jgi:hypothetical protein